MGPEDGVELSKEIIEAAKNSKYIDRIIVSTDDDEIKAVAMQYGADVPFKRPADLSEDVPTEDVVIHAIDWLKKNELYSPDIVVCLEPPVPYRKAEHIDNCVNAILEDKSIDSAITVTNVRGMRPEWMVRITNENSLSFSTISCAFFPPRGNTKALAILRS